MAQKSLFIPQLEEGKFTAFFNFFYIRCIYPYPTAVLGKDLTESVMAGGFAGVGNSGIYNSNNSNKLLFLLPPSAVASAVVSLYSLKEHVRSCRIISKLGGFTGFYLSNDINIILIKAIEYKGN
jgi:hypothetical protein